MNNKNLKVFSSEEINNELNSNLVGWEYDGKWIRKRFKTHNWKSTIMLVNVIGHVSEVGWHHPDLAVSYAFVEVKLMTHVSKGITELDFELAKKIDEVVLWNPSKEDNKLEGTPTDPKFAYVKY